MTETGFAHTFTVFTPTYNRAHTLARVYESLKAQTFRDFEWLVVDDGSTDDTAAVIAGFAAAADFPVRYVRQENAGKHVAFNRGVREARGELFLTLDSDDECVPHALERFWHHWRSIPADVRDRFSAVTGLCVDQHSQRVGDPFPFDPTDSDSIEMRYRYRVSGEKWGFQRTAVLRRFPYPEPTERVLVPESVVWSAIAREYKTRYVNEPLRIYWRDEGNSLSSQSVLKSVPSRVYYATDLDLHAAWLRHAPLELYKTAAVYARFCFLAGDPLGVQAGRLKSLVARALWAMALPAGLALAWRDRRQAPPPPVRELAPE